VNVPLKLLSPEAFLTQNAQNIVSLRPLAGFKGPTSKGRGGEGRRAAEKTGRKRGEERGEGWEEGVGNMCYWP